MMSLTDILYVESHVTNKEIGLLFLCKYFCLIFELALFISARLLLLFRTKTSIE